MEQTSIWIIGIVALAIGGLIGYLLGRSGSDAGERQTLQRQLDEAREELGGYKQEVTEHFEKTAELVNQLTQSYRDVHQHLAQGAQTLGASEAARLALKDVMQPRLEETEEESPREAAEGRDEAAPIPVITDVVENEEAEKMPEPPRDYATKAADEEGTLSERYGLDSDKDEGEDVRDPSQLAELKRRQKATEEVAG
ncbi:YhcB family protein [Marinobacterium aestuariivivens]|uniref:Z-ring associated protein G n=1 Tax=Marinobacterium aestuariivivens TaxID=1698799 RepID=A0ABW1ZWA7_9GAMM